ncbi:hypothetical protein BV22DRAFT_1108389 [Leucogyrophana mollusca]|uniref:Uncharacterized protein n=1 Tax=Leucogyrophana mollusca TaxID=85980 RepID=A0ACB8AY64_9AGAM|nr:hypothetical protein BV22DRAFT_1108389 [Leucogyrophana mollusca]
MRTLVNSLTSKMEIGAPMASLYLLGNPDHYTSHSFVPFYWKSFVHKARNDWDNGNICVVGTLPVFDYLFRPSAFGHMNLYDWVQFSECKPMKKRSLCSSEGVDNELCVMSSNEDIGKPGESDSTPFFSFLPNHPLHLTHDVRCVYRNRGRVPNFNRGSLPRHDRGNREYYCTIMLVLFQPWRCGHELKGANQTWGESFGVYAFNEQATEIMKHFNVRYECLDARDDYSARWWSEEREGPC